MIQKDILIYWMNLCHFGVKKFKDESTYEYDEYKDNVLECQKSKFKLCKYHKRGKKYKIYYLKQKQ